MPDFEQRIAESFARMGLMHTLGAELTYVMPGEVHIAVWPKPEITQHHGFVHAGALTAVADTGCGYAAMTLGPEGHEVLTVEFKVNFLRPATAERFVAKATVVKPGRSLSVCQCDVVAHDGEKQLSVALMQCTIMTVPPELIPGG
ncbi:MAG: PaaI family thioesterase [Pseudomonadota bacterium]